MSVLNVGTLNSTGGVKLPVYSSGNFPSGPDVQVGQIIFDSTDEEIRLYNGNGWVGLYPQFYADILVVGSGGSAGGSFGGGGGGGGVIYKRAFPMTSGMSWDVRVGGGTGTTSAQTDQGQKGSDGNYSRFGHFHTDGGGGGSSRGTCSAGCIWGVPAGYGGSGGGGGHANTGNKTIPGQGLPGQGFNGGWGRNNTSGTPNHASGGGGGAGGPGGDYCEGSSGGKGGDGFKCEISGTTEYYGAGGGGGVYTNGSGGSGGTGGGGNGGRYQSGQLRNGTDGTFYGAGGGGGGYTHTGGSGYQGVVIVRYSGGQRATGGTITSVGGYTIHTFDTPGNSTFSVN